MAEESKSNGNAKIIIIVLAVAGAFFFGIIMIGIIAAIALPNFIGAQDKAREASVKANMRTAQIASEQYAVDHKGLYPVNLEELQPYYPGGDSNSNPGHASVNPFTNESEWPVVKSFIQVSQASELDKPHNVGIGTVEYTPVKDEKEQCTAYIICGGDKDGETIVDNRTPENFRNKKPLILSNKFGEVGKD